MYLIPIPAFTDNYLWLLHDGQKALVVDPGDAGPVRRVLEQHGLTLESILVTHHHADPFAMARPGQVLARAGGAGDIDLHGDHHAIRWQRAGQRQGRASGAGADLENPPCPARQRQRVQQDPSVGEPHRGILTRLRRPSASLPR